MSKTQRTVTAGLWGLVVVSLLTLLAMQRWQSRAEAARADVARRLKAGEVFEVIGDGQLVPATQRSDPYTFPAPTFKLTDQNSQPFDSDALRGKVWTASFFFSQCQGVCPAMTERIAELQSLTSDPDVHFVSFSVDPERDTPARLHAYAAEAKADAARWHLLVGEAAEMQRIAREFKLPFSTPAEHSGKILLVDGAGTVRGFYETKDGAAIDRLKTDLARLTRGEAVTRGEVSTPGGMTR